MRIRSLFPFAAWLLPLLYICSQSQPVMSPLYIKSLCDTGKTKILLCAAFVFFPQYLSKTNLGRNMWNLQRGCDEIGFNIAANVYRQDDFGVYYSTVALDSYWAINWKHVHFCLKKKKKEKKVEQVLHDHFKSVLHLCIYRHKMFLSLICCT